jgi:predicted ArsR family transcriptional regulator
MGLKDLVVRGPVPSEARIWRKSRRGRPAKKYCRRNHSREPQKIDEESWFYDDSNGLLVVHEFRTDAGDYVRTDQFVIPWRLVLAAVKRHQLVAIQ